MDWKEECVSLCALNVFENRETCGQKGLPRVLSDQRDCDASRLGKVHPGKPDWTREGASFLPSVPSAAWLGHPWAITEPVLLSHGWLPLPVTWGHCEEAS